MVSNSFCNFTDVFHTAVLNFNLDLKTRRGTKKTACTQRPANKLIARSLNLE